MKNKNKDKVVLYSFIIISTLTFILFFQYIIGNKTFFSMRVISDGIMQFYPNHVEFARVLKKRVFGTFSWTHGWGGYIFDSNPFSLLMVSFGENRIIYMTGIIVVVKTIIAGFCFSLYLKELKIEKKVNIIYSIFYALSVQVVCGGCIQSQAELAIILAIFLYAIEKFRNKKNLGAFFFGAILTVLCLQLYFIITMCAFLIAYIIATNYYRNNLGYKIKKIHIIIFLTLFIMIIVVFFTSFKNIFYSYRFKKGLDFLSESTKKIWTLKNIKIIMTTFIRSFTPNGLGILGDNTYYGEEYGWYFADGTFYAGILTLLMLPQAFSDNKKRNIVFALALIALGLITFLPPVRLVLAGFGNDEFRLIRIWFIFIIIYISMTASNDIFSGKKELKKRKLYITSAIYIIILSFGFSMHIYLYNYLCVIAFIIIYNLLLTVNIKKSIRNVAIIVFVSVEVVLSNYQFINNGDIIYSKEWTEDKLYNDGTKEAVGWISENDSELYRVDKAYMSVMLNDASIQNYYGTAYYIGGIGLQNRIDFNISMALPTMFNNRNYCMGSCGNIYADSLLAVKYSISHSDTFYQYGYEFAHNENNLNIFYNTNSLPFAFFYDSYMDSQEYGELSLDERRNNILKYAISDTELGKLTRINKNEIIKRNANIIWDYSVDGYICGDVITLQPLEENQVLVVEAVSDEEYNLGLKWAVNGIWENDNSQYMSIYEENGNSIAEITGQPGTDYIVFYGYGTTNKEEIDRINIKIYDAEEYYSILNEVLKEKRNDNIIITSHSNEKVSFDVDTDNDKLLFLSIPYDTDFDIYVDGNKVEKYKINYAFTGVLVSKGKHTVEAVYNKKIPKQFIEAFAVAILYLVLTIYKQIKKKCNLSNKREERK